MNKNWDDMTEAEKIECLRHTDIWIGDLVRVIGLSLVNLGQEMARHGESLRLAYGAKPSAEVEREQHEQKWREFMYACVAKAPKADTPVMVDKQEGK
jgi:hypothetical protein